MDSKLMKTYPSVYVVNEDYCVCVLMKEDVECTMWVEVDGVNYYDHSNGILRSKKFVHMVKIPQKEMDRTGKYIVHLRQIIHRKPYDTEFGDIESTEYSFRAIAKEKNPLHIINLADAHYMVSGPISAGSYFGDELDLLVMNGDIADSSESLEAFRNVYVISGNITKGKVPCVFARGNHEMRGAMAEYFADYMPTDAGRSYYTFSLGDIWGIVLDTGEDKADDCIAYGHTICCDVFRQEEEAFLERVIADKKYQKARVRLIISHTPITIALGFENERYAMWSKKLQELKPTLMLHGHLHKCFLANPGSERDSYGLQPCPLICSSQLSWEEGTYKTGAITLYDSHVEVQYVNGI